jgi:hypothetical protein
MKFAVSAARMTVQVMNWEGCGRMAMAYFKVLFQNLSGGIEENQE